LKLYDGHFHDLLNDIDKEKAMSDIKQWINARIAANCAVGGESAPGSGVITETATLDRVLRGHAAELATDFVGYRNHACRVANLCVAGWRDATTMARFHAKQTEMS
jgi:hypothetical protein